MLSERRSNRLLNRHLSYGLPEFLIKGDPGLHSGFAGAQYPATALVAENRTIGPASIHSVPSNGDNQDVVSMGFIAARNARRVLRNNHIILALEFLAAAQAVDVSGRAGPAEPGRPDHLRHRPVAGAHPRGRPLHGRRPGAGRRPSWNAARSSMPSTTPASTSTEERSNMTTYPEAQQETSALSLQQQFLCLFAQGFDAGPFGPQYAEVGGWRIRGRVDADILRLALADVVERHEALRTVIVHLEDGGSQSVVCRRVQPELRVVELYEPPGAGRDQRAEQLMIETEARPFQVDESRCCGPCSAASTSRSRCWCSTATTARRMSGRCR